MYQTSARFDVIIINTWILTDTRRSKNIKKNIKFVWKTRTQHRPNKQDSYLKKRLLMKKAKQPFYRFYMLKTHTDIQISYKPVVQASLDFKILMHTSKRRRKKF